MVRKLFALASVTALTGLVASITAAGCSSTEVINVADASTDVRRDAPRPGEGGDTTVSCKTATTYTKETLNPPAARTNDCTAEQIEALATACMTGADADPNGTKCTAARNLSANTTCAQCVFGTDTDPQWKVVNLNPDSDTRPVRFNQAGCIEHASEVKGCGDQLVTLNICLNRFCSKCTTDADQGACIDEVYPEQGEGECSAYELSTACGKAAFDTATPAAKKKSEAVNDCFFANNDVDDVRLFTHMATLACANPTITDAGNDADAN